MHFFYTLAVVTCVLVLSGCDRISAISMSPSEKINRAIPIPPELITAQSVLYTALESNKKDAQRTAEQFEQLLTVRALTCAGTTRIGRFEMPSDIKSKFTDLDCFKKQDAVLADWIGLQRVALALRQPALRAYTDLKGKVIIPSAENSVSMSAAAAANIAVVKSNTGKFTTVDLSGGKPISSFQAPGEAYRVASVSPNGRMMAVPVSNRSLTIYELETGSILWTTDKYSDLVAWIPSIEAVVLNETGASKAALMDLRTGRSEPYLSAERNLTWALAMPGAASQVLIGSQNSVSLMDHARTAEGNISSTTTKQWRLNGSGASSQTPMLLLNGKFLAFISNRDLGWLNLENSEQGVWDMSGLQGHGFAKLNETNIIFTARPPSAGKSVRNLLDIERLTVSAALDISATEGYALPFTPRSGYAKSLNSALIIENTAQTDTPQLLSQLIADAQLAQQMAKLQAQSDVATQAASTKYDASEIAVAEAAAAALSAAAASALPRLDRQNYMDLLARQVRAQNAASAMRDGLPREVVERIRNGTHQNMSAGSTGRSASPAPAAKSLLADIPNNAQVAMVGVYQAPRSGATVMGNGTRPPGNVGVTLGAGSTPLVLVLTSYEPVRWNIKNTGGRKIAAVLLSGYSESEVAGLTNTRILKIGSGYAYKLDSPEYNRLKTDVSRYVSNPITSFQGRYEGQEFAVGQ